MGQTTVDIARLQMEAPGAETFADRIKACNAQLETFQSDLKLGVIPFDVFEASVAATTLELERLRAEVAKVAAAQAGMAKHTTAFSGSAKDAEKASRRMGQGFLELSRGVEDAQYGIRGVLNNIPMMIERFGGSAGLAAGVSLTAVAFTVLLPAIQAVIRSLSTEPVDNFGRSLEAMKKHIEWLEANPHKIAIDFRHIEDAKKEMGDLEKRLKAFEAAADRTTIEEKSGKAVAAAVQDDAGTAKNLKSLLFEVLGTSGVAADSPEKKALADTKERIEFIEKRKPIDETEALANAQAIEQLRASIPKLENDISEAAKNAIGETIGGAQRGEPEAMHDLLAALYANRDAMLKGAPEKGIQGVTPSFIPLLEEARPEVIQAKEKAARRAEMDEGLAKLDDEIRKKREAAEKKAQDQSEADAGKDIGAQMKVVDDEDAAKERSKKLALEATRRHVTQQVKDEDQSIKQGGYVPRAEELLARTRAQGGAYDSSGRFHKMTDEQIIQYVVSEVQKDLHRVVGQNQYGQNVRANPGMGREQTGDLANVITARARDDLTQRLATTGGAGLSNTGKLIQISGQLAGEVQRQAAEVAAQGMAINQLLKATSPSGRNGRNRGG